MKTTSRGCPSWAMGLALAVLALQAPRNGRFDEASLWVWMSEYVLERPARAALQAMRNSGYVTPVTPLRSNGVLFNQVWQLTDAGREAAEAAALCLHQGEPDASALSTRLWNLLRIRRRLTSEEAASVLVDACDAATWARHKKAIARWLRAWATHAPDVVTTAAKRDAGHVRYVLLRDLGVWPPPSRAGQMHPSRFAKVSIPERFKRTAPQSTEAVEEP